jgi:hypothetical protein
VLSGGSFAPLDAGSTWSYVLSGGINKRYDWGVFIAGYATNGVVANPQPGYTDVYIAALDQGTDLTIEDEHFVELEAKTYAPPAVFGGISARASADHEWDAVFNPNNPMDDQGVFSLQITSVGTATEPDDGPNREAVWQHAQGTLAAELLPSRSGSNDSVGTVDVCVRFSDSAASSSGFQQFIPDAGGPADAGTGAGAADGG